jgi:lambda repressor-like predicted transcriptional regulator
MAHSISIRFPLAAITGCNNSELARRTGFALRTIQRWTTTGIPLYSADRLAIRLGVHPATIWTNWFTV